MSRIFNTFNALNNYLLTKPHRSKLYSSLLKTFIKPKEPDKWVFIVGCYNSGTTLLEKLLSFHSDISVIDEGVFKTDELSTPEEFGWPRMWVNLYEKIKLDDSSNINVEKVKNDWALLFDKNKNVFLEKSIVNSARMKWIQKNFKDPYFIFIVRNGYAVAEGIRRKAGNSEWKMPPKYQYKYPIELCARQWNFCNKIIENQSKSIVRIIKIFYEDLCDDYLKVLKNLCEFLDIKYENLFLENNSIEIHGVKSKIENKNYKSIRSLSKEDILKINRNAYEMLNHYNYNIIN